MSSSLFMELPYMAPSFPDFVVPQVSSLYEAQCVPATPPHQQCFPDLSIDYDLDSLLDPCYDPKELSKDGAADMLLSELLSAPAQTDFVPEMMSLQQDCQVPDPIFDCVVPSVLSSPYSSGSASPCFVPDLDASTTSDGFLSLMSQDSVDSSRCSSPEFVAEAPAKKPAARTRAPKRTRKAATTQRKTKKPKQSARDKRDFHNVSERLRRKELKESLDTLRLQIPELVDNDKIHTAQLLNKAIEFIRQMQAEDEQFEREKAQLRAENARLAAGLM